MNPHTTDELLKILNSLDSTEDLEEYDRLADESHVCTSFSDFLSKQIEQSGLSVGEVIRKADIQRTYGYQILNGGRQPGRDKVISLCLALSLPLEEVQRALNIAQEAALYPKRRRDSILIFGINQKLGVREVNDLLFEMKEKPLD